MAHPPDELLERDLEACRALRPAEPKPGAADLERLRAGAQRLVAEDAGAVGALRSLPTGQRLALAALAALLVPALVAALAGRPDLAAYPLGQMVAALSVFALTIALCWRLLRPLYRAPASPTSTYLLGGLALLAPVLLALAPLLSSYAGAPAGEGNRFWAAVARCFGFGCLLGLPVLLLVLGLRRDRAGGLGLAVLAGLVAGLVGNLALQLHCPRTDVSHVLVGHGLLLLPFGVAAILWSSRGQR